MDISADGIKISLRKKKKKVWLNKFVYLLLFLDQLQV